MRSIPYILSIVLLFGFLFTAVSPADGHGYQERKCQGKYKGGGKPTTEELSTILKGHLAWLISEPRKDDDERRADLCEADLRAPKLAELLYSDNLQWAHLERTRLQGVDLSYAQFQGADLRGADLQAARLHNANLQWAHLEGAKLQEADLYNANLQWAHLEDNAELQEAYLDQADLKDAYFEAKPGSLPNVPSLAGAQNLQGITFHESPHALVELREKLKQEGLREQKRRITYAIEHTRMLQSWQGTEGGTKKGKDPRQESWYENLQGKSESLFSYVLFELTCDYGMSPGRLLRILGCSILLFSLVYMFAITCKQSQIWVDWPKDHVQKDKGDQRGSACIDNTFLFPGLQSRGANKWWGILVRWACIPLTGFLFSLLSAFQLGWRDLNVGTWISRVQPRDYTLRGTGWVRTVSGIQSLLSVYLLALWVLTYFGDPFE